MEAPPKKWHETHSEKIQQALSAMLSYADVTKDAQDWELKDEKEYKEKKILVHKKKTKPIHSIRATGEIQGSPKEIFPIVKGIECCPQWDPMCT